MTVVMLILYSLTSLFNILSHKLAYAFVYEIADQGSGYWGVCRKRRANDQQLTDMSH